MPKGGMSAEHGARRFRVGEVPPLAEGYTDRPDTARGILDALVPGSVLALVPGSAFAEGPSNWLGACGKTQIAVIVAESLWRSTAIDALIWISATSRESVLSAYVEASAAAFGIAPTGTAESVAARLVSWLATTDQRWMIVLDDLQDQTDLDGLWPEGPSGRVLVTSMQASLTSGRRGIQVIPVGFFSIREALNCLTERLSVNPVQRHGAIDLIEALGREPLALAQAASVVANSTLACRDYRDYFARRRQQIGVAAGEVPSAAAVTWTLSLGQAESLLPGASVRLMLVLVAMFDGHGVPGGQVGGGQVRGHDQGVRVARHQLGVAAGGQVPPVLDSGPDQACIVQAAPGAQQHGMAAIRPQHVGGRVMQGSRVQSQGRRGPWPGLVDGPDFQQGIGGGAGRGLLDVGRRGQPDRRLEHRIHQDGGR